MADYHLGMNAKLYYYEDGVGSGNSQTELTNCQDVTVNMTVGEADITTRGSGGYKEIAATLKDVSVDFNMVWDDTDTGFTVLNTAFLAGGVIGIEALHEESGDGPKFDGIITSFTRDESLTEALSAKVTIKPTRSDTAFEWVDG